MKTSAQAKGKASTSASVPSRSRASHRFVVADDNALIRELVAHFLRESKGHATAVRTVDSADAAIETCRELKPDLLLMELNAVKANGAAEFERVRKIAPGTRLLVYAVAATDRDIVKVLRSGVDGFVDKATTRAQFLEAVDRITHGGNYFCPRSNRLLTEIAQGMHSSPETRGGSELSRREREILNLIADGHTSKEIAARLGLSAATVDTHRRNAMGKVGARNAADLIRYGYTHGLLAEATSHS